VNVEAQVVQAPAELQTLQFLGQDAHVVNAVTYWLDKQAQAAVNEDVGDWNVALQAVHTPVKAVHVAQ